MSGIRAGDGRARTVLSTALIGAAALAGTLLMAGRADAAAYPPGTNGKIVFAQGSDVYVMNQDGSGKTNLTPNGTPADYNPAFSPDGKKIVFASNRPGSTTNDVWVMNADGSNPVDLTPGVAGTQELPAWSPDGKKIVYTDEQVGNGDTFVMNADGSNKVNLTTDNPTDWDSQPNYSPDGMRIAFTRCQGPSTPCAIWVMNADGSGKAPLTTPDGGASEDDFAAYFSPDGKQLAFVRCGASRCDTAVVPVTGGHGTVITSGLSGDTNVHPGWSPDGTRIAITSGTGSTTQDIWLVNPDGSNPVNLTTDSSTLPDTQPDWESIYTCRDQRAGIVGTLGNDTLPGTTGPDVIFAMAGFDQVDAGTGDDLVCGGDGGGTLAGAGGKDLVEGGSGADQESGAAGKDTLIGLDGNDKQTGGKGKDKLKGGKGKDKLKGSKGNDKLKGGKGKDFLNGGPGIDKCNGGPGKDVLKNCEKGKA